MTMLTTNVLGRVNVLIEDRTLSAVRPVRFGTEQEAQSAVGPQDTVFRLQSSDGDFWAKLRILDNFHAELGGYLVDVLHTGVGASPVCTVSHGRRLIEMHG